MKKKFFLFFLLILGSLSLGAQNSVVRIMDIGTIRTVPLDTLPPKAGRDVRTVIGFKVNKIELVSEVNIYLGDEINPSGLKKIVGRVIFLSDRFYLVVGDSRIEVKNMQITVPVILSESDNKRWKKTTVFMVDKLLFKSNELVDNHY